jgi:hypothetical protein
LIRTKVARTLVVVREGGLCGPQALRRDFNPGVPRFLARFLALALFCSTLLLPGAALAADGTITGQIVGKNGAGNLGGTPVTLTIATATGDPIERTVRAGDDGRFTFENVPLANDAFHLLKVVYDGGNYFRAVEVAAGATSADAGPIEVYRSFRADDGLSFSRMNTIIVAPNEEGVQLIETGGYLNNTDRAYTGRASTQDALTARFGLPVGAFNLNPQLGLNRDTLVLLDEPPLLGVATIEAVPPGDNQFAYIYQMRSQAGVITFDRVFPYRTDLYTLYLPTSARLESGGNSVPILDNGVAQLPNGQQARVFTATNIPAGGRLTVRLSNLPQPQEESNPLVPAMMVFMFVLGFGLIVVYGRQRRQSPVTAAAQRQIKTVPGGIAKPRVATPPAADDPSPGDLAARKEALLLELVELDERHDAGELPADEYRRHRQQRKEALVATLRALEGQEARPVGGGARGARRGESER